MSKDLKGRGEGPAQISGRREFRQREQEVHRVPEAGPHLLSLRNREKSNEVGAQ